jgi:hypothetical protein
VGDVTNVAHVRQHVTGWPLGRDPDADERDVEDKAAAWGFQWRPEWERLLANMLSE